MQRGGAGSCSEAGLVHAARRGWFMQRGGAGGPSPIKPLSIDARGSGGGPHAPAEPNAAAGLGHWASDRARWGGVAGRRSGRRSGRLSQTDRPTVGQRGGQ
jgi:hypothetical protein